MTPAPTTAPAALFVAEKIDGTGARHLATASRRNFGAVTYCTGRTMSYMIGTDQPVTCAACLRRAAANGIDVAEVEAR